MALWDRRILKEMLLVTLTFDPMSQFLYTAPCLDMEYNYAMFHPNPTIKNKVMGWKGVLKKTPERKTRQKKLILKVTVKMQLVIILHIAI